MSFDLRIRFTGLMMWVPEGQTAMHVLMPKMAAHEHKEGEGKEHEKMPQHFARLVYDVAYENEKSTQFAREYQMVDLTGAVLDFTRVSSPEVIIMHLPDELPNMRAVADPVDPKILQTLSDPRLAARVDFHSGQMTDYQLGPRFTFEDPDKPRRIAPSTEWTIRNVLGTDGKPTTSLSGVTIRRIGSETPLAQLHPINGTIHLEAFYVVDDFLPPHDRDRFNPGASGEDAHFDAYYELCPPGAGGRILPRASTRKEVEVRSKVLKQPGGEVPGAVCGQTQGRSV